MERYIDLDCKDHLMEELRGKVFHVTSDGNRVLIEKSGGISPNKNCEWETLYGNTENGYFRLRDCVSFFDYREYGTENWQAHYYKCTPTQLFAQTNIIVIYVLSPTQYHKLVSWEGWKKEECFSQRVVPYIEAGHPGLVELKHISEIIVVNYEAANKAI